MNKQIKVEYAPAATLKPFIGNPRKIETEEMNRLRRSLREFGFIDPVICRREDNMVIGGHQRLAAARLEGIESVPVVYIDGLSDDQAALLNVALNKIAGEFDWSKLGDLFGELDTGDVDLTLSGFDLDEIAGLGEASGQDWEDAMEGVGTAAAPGFRQMTFTLTDAQAEAVIHAMGRAKGMGPYVDTGNVNGNGNAIARVAETFNGYS